MSERRFIESENFLDIIPLIDEKAKSEKNQANRPIYWNMIFWWTRKPLIAARVFTAASLLPENYDIQKFKDKVKLLDIYKRPHEQNPTIFEEFKDKKVLDPFAGFGSIPLEALRLGVGKVVASDLLPMATFLERVVLEYPKKYGAKLLNDVKKYGEELLKELEEYVKELYDDVDGYVGTWEIKCPGTDFYSPMLNNFWLLKLKGNDEEDEEGTEEEEENTREAGTYKKLVFMTYEKVGNEIKIKPFDLNEILGKSEIKAKITGNVIEVDSKRYEVSEGNIKLRNNYARCLQNNNLIQKDKGNEWYVREALKEWNQNYEKFLRGEIDFEQLRNSKVRPCLLLKFKGQEKSLKFYEINRADEEKFWSLFERLKGIISIIPFEEIPQDTRRFPAGGFDRWFKIYNPRQLLLISKIIELIKKIKNSIDDEEYAEAIASYLTVALLNYTRHNSMMTSIESSRKFISHALAFRGISIKFNWVEISPLADIVGSLRKSLEHIYEGLEYLVEALNQAPGDIEVINSDAVELQLQNKFDSITTDPPYFDDVPYPELSDYYYVWYTKIFDLPEISQYESVADRDISVAPERAKKFGDDVGSEEYFRKRLSETFKNLVNLLKDDGIFVTFYNHTNPEAWKTLIYAGWIEVGLRVSAVNAITTEDTTRITARNVSKSLDKSMVVVWRKIEKNKIKPLNEVKKEALDYTSSWLKKYIEKNKNSKENIINLDLYFVVLGKVLEVFTSYTEIIGVKKDFNGVGKLVEEHIFPTVSNAIIRALGEITGYDRFSTSSAIYILLKLLIDSSPNKRRAIDPTTLTMLDVTAGNVKNTSTLEKEFVIIAQDTNGSKSKKGLILNEPYGKSVSDALMNFSDIKGLEEALNDNIVSAVQVLHYLEYLAGTNPKFKDKIEEIKSKVPQVEEALGIAKVLAYVLPKDDIEKKLCEKLVGEEKRGIDVFLR
ncbi:DUF1156 domain-containing protein [Acidianus sulfidivorans JP7]|uniref:DNA methyltransferase n=1 Tax=Acidianus sulfidivorans JP7 TaxID=619593 RepID=A0A2U9IJB3_9CREN|nr:DUF1156 domain-containing protein [Acidianus sulfidivorans]AWR98152.1 DUF1156 domain-containing protein [Acidianus sulfidivorans JP7]